MPPKYQHQTHMQDPSPSPPPDNDAHDILVIHDIMDTLDQLPPELTRVHSDLNELGAVLYCKWNHSAPVHLYVHPSRRTAVDYATHTHHSPTYNTYPSPHSSIRCCKCARLLIPVDTLCNLENKLNTLIKWIQDASIGPERRFDLLQDIAEEAARYKLGGDDKIRVAGGACDGVSLRISDRG